MCESAEFRERLVNLARNHGGFDKLSRLCGLKESTVRKWAAGPSEPNRSRLVSLARGAGVSVEWLAVGGGAQEEVKPLPAVQAGVNPIAAEVLRRLGGMLDDYLSHECDRETVVDKFNAALDALSWFREKAPMQRKPGGGDA